MSFNESVSRAFDASACGRSCWIEFPATIDVPVAVDSLLTDFEGAVKLNTMGLANAMEAISHGEAADIYFGLACDIGDPLETEFIAAAEALGGKYTGS